jgi:hypothetical protein
MMDMESRQIRQESQQLLKKMSTGRYATEYGDYRVVSHQQTAYQAASFVKRIVTPDQYEQLNDLLHQLWRLNEEFVGELISDTSTYLALTGEHASLEESYVQWCDSYLRARLKKPNHKDQGDPFSTFARLLLEYTRVIGATARHDSADFICLDRSHRYVAWLLFENTWKDSVKIIQEGTTLRIGAASTEFAEYCGGFATKFGFGQNGLAEFLSLAEPYVVAKQSNEVNDVLQETLLDEIGGLMNDIWQMRPFLIRNFSPEKTLIQLNERLHIACDWAANVGAMTLYVGQSEREVIENLPARRSITTVSVGRDGILIDGYRPWITAGNLEHTADVRKLAINAHVLGLIHERLFSFYDRIDFARIRQRAIAELNADEVGNDALALSLQDLASETETTELAKERRLPTARRLRPLRLDKFLKLLEQRFNCEVQSGKGDETTVFRPGGKKYRLGQLKQIHPTLLKRVLQRLKIGRTEWLQIVYG